MDLGGNLQAIDCAYTSSLVELRRLFSREITTSISKVRRRVQQAQNEFDTEVHRLRKENESLIQSLEQMKEIIEGKEIEIYGLRHQLQSFSAGRTVCYNCSRSLVSTLDCGDTMKSKTPAMKGTAIGLNNKRPLKNISSMSDGLSDSALSSRIQPPITKRACLQEDGVENFRPEKTDNATPNGVRKSPCGAAADDSQLDVETSRSESTTLTTSVFPVPSLSPPSEVYDASLAIRNAINHNDLADYDATYRDSSMLDKSRVVNKRNILQPASNNRGTRPVDVESGLHSKQMPDKLTRTNSIDHVAYPHKCKYIHRPSCRYFRRTLDANGNKHEKQKSDDTGDDISLPSDFLESEVSVAPNPLDSIDNDVSKKVKEPKCKSHLPSIGGSPTRGGDVNFKYPRPPSRRTLVEKKPVSKVNNNGSSRSKRKSNKRSPVNKSPSTPTGFWNLDLEASVCNDINGKENISPSVMNTDDAEAATAYPFRRRRPLSFPSV
ncbi:unnamed protein product [Heterobilharzia americana]|nr:unnamed protein product [Heterobilharzia americana]